MRDGARPDRRPRELLAGRRSGSRRDVLTYAQLRAAARRAGVELVPGAGLVEALRAVKEPREIARRSAQAAAISTRSSRARRGALHRPDRARARLVDRASSSTSSAPTGSPFETIVAAARTAPARTRGPATGRSRPASTLVTSTRAAASTATAPTARAPSRPATLPDELARGLRGLPRGAARRARGGAGRVSRGATPTRPRAT